MSQAQQAPGTPAPRTSGMAIASLICGILGISCVPFIPSIVAIALGHISRSDIAKSNGAKTGSGVALGGLIFGYLGVLIIVGMLGLAIILPAIAVRKSSAITTRDLNNLKQLNVALMMYADDNHGVLPPDLATLVETNYVIDGRLFKHPVDKSEPPKTADDIRNGNCGYVFTAGEIDLATITDPDTTIILYSLPRSMHLPTCVAFADGGVSQAPGEDIDSICRLNGWTLPEKKKLSKPDRSTE